MSISRGKHIDALSHEESVARSKAARRRYYERNKEICLARARAQREERRKDPSAMQAWHMYQRNRMLLQRYGITHAEYETMFKKQGGKCAICKDKSTGVHKRYLDVDHCHSTGRVRGLLCGSCNKNLALLESGWVNLATPYLENS